MTASYPIDGGCDNLSFGMGQAPGETPGLVLAIMDGGEVLSWIPECWLMGARWSSSVMACSIVLGCAFVHEFHPIISTTFSLNVSCLGAY